MCVCKYHPRDRYRIEVCLSHFNQEEEARRNPSRHPELNRVLQEYEDAGGRDGVRLYWCEAADPEHHSGRRWLFADGVTCRSLGEAVAHVESLVPQGAA